MTYLRMQALDWTAILNRLLNFFPKELAAVTLTVAEMESRYNAILQRRPSIDSNPQFLPDALAFRGHRLLQQEANLNAHRSAMHWKQLTRVQSEWTTMMVRTRVPMKKLIPPPPAPQVEPDGSKSTKFNRFGEHSLGLLAMAASSFSYAK
jgi:hypothetical protein